MEAVKVNELHSESTRYDSDPPLRDSGCGGIPVKYSCFDEEKGSSSIVTVYVRVPYNLVGLIVGTKGATVKSIQYKTGALIVSPNKYMDPVFTISGNPERVEMAKEEIAQQIRNTSGACSRESEPSKSSDQCLNHFDRQPLTDSTNLRKKMRTKSLSVDPHRLNEALKAYHYCDVRWLPDADTETNSTRPPTLYNKMNPRSHQIQTNITFSDPCIGAIASSRRERYYSEGHYKTNRVSPQYVPILSQGDNALNNQKLAKGIFCIMCHGGTSFLQLFPCSHGPFCEKCSEMFSRSDECPICKAGVIGSEMYELSRQKIQ